MKREILTFLFASVSFCIGSGTGLGIPVLSSLRMDGELLNVFGLEIDRTISTGKLHALLHFHTQPIDVVVFHGSQGKPGFEAGFPLRCFQRLSFPHLATRLCRWRDNRSTRGASIPVLSY